MDEKEIIAEIKREDEKWTKISKLKELRELLHKVVYAYEDLDVCLEEHMVGPGFSAVPMAKLYEIQESWINEQIGELI